MKPDILTYYRHYFLGVFSLDPLAGRAGGQTSDPHGDLPKSLLVA